MKIDPWTGGDWRVNTAGSGNGSGGITIDEYYVYSPSVVDDVAIASDIIDPETGKPSKENAALIAAAPDLLRALEAFVCARECGLREDLCDVWAREAIKKARSGA